MIFITLDPFVYLGRELQTYRVLLHISCASSDRYRCPGSIELAGYFLPVGSFSMDRRGFFGLPGFLSPNMSFSNYSNNSHSLCGTLVLSIQRLALIVTPQPSHTPSSIPEGGQAVSALEKKKKYICQDYFWSLHIHTLRVLIMNLSCSPDKGSPTLEQKNYAMVNEP